MTDPRRPHDERPGPDRPEDDRVAPDLLDVKATDELLDRLGRGERPPVGEPGDELLTRSLAALATESREVGPEPSLDDLLLAAGLVLTAPSDTGPGSLARVDDPSTAPVDLAVLGRTATTAGPAGPLGTGRERARAAWHGLTRTPAGRLVSSGASRTADGARRGLGRLGVDLEDRPHVSPMIVAAAAVVAFGLAGVASGVLGADPVVPSQDGTTQLVDGEVAAADVVAMLDKARAAQLLGDEDTAAYYFNQASGMIVNVAPAERELVSQQVASVGEELGLAVPAPASGSQEVTAASSPTTAVATTEAAEPVAPATTTSSTTLTSTPTTVSPSPTTTTTTTTTRTSTSTPTSSPTPTTTTTTPPTPTPEPTATSAGSGAAGDSADS